MIQSRPNEDLRGSEPMAGGPGDETKNRLKQHGEETKRQAKELGQKASEAARDASESLKQAGKEAADRVTETARQTGEQVRERASAVVADRKSRLADEVSVVGQALHRAADTLDENDDAQLGHYAHRAGDFVDSCARYLRDANASEMVRGVSDFTRRHPELVLGGLFLAGLSFSRFLKASDRHQDRYDFDRGYDFDSDGRDIGYETSDTFAGRYDGQATSLSYSRNEDIPAATSPQPGSYPPSTIGTASPSRLTDETDAIGQSESSGTGPNCPR